MDIPGLKFSNDPVTANAANKAAAIAELTKNSEIEYPGGFSYELTTEQKIDALYVQMQEILAFVENINNQVAPFMEKLKNSPLGAMFGA